MNALEVQLKNINPSLYSKFVETKKEVTLLLGKYSDNFPTYTDHSISHTLEVFEIAAEILDEDEIKLLNSDEIYILSMACILHDIGMCIPEEKIIEISESEDLIAYKHSQPNLSKEEYIRDIHHLLSEKFILHEWELLKIPNKKYAKAIGTVSAGHRKVELGNFDIYDPVFFVKNGKDYVSLPYLACIIRIADELDVTNSRTPRILAKYYMPNNEVSIREWKKHIATSQRNYLSNKVIFEVSCTDQNIYAALQEQFDKIQNVINYCQKVIRAIPYAKEKVNRLNLNTVEVKYDFIGFDPKGIKFSFDVQNVVNAFIGEDLYNNKLTSLREAIQNSIDSCRYKSKVLRENYNPIIKIVLESNYLEIQDNGAGMDLFIIENFFGRLASSFYEQEKIKNQFEAIGQFGVGVFSYFLMGEYIDIETKAESTPAYKFRFDKDPKSYFHFYDKTTRKDSGTTIKINLKKNNSNVYSINMMENYIKKTFRHIEIPLEICVNGQSLIHNKKTFEFDSNKEIKDRLKVQYKKLFPNFKIVDVKISNENYEGICGIIVAKDYIETFKYSNRYFDYDVFNSINNHRTMSEIAISQKGVFVNNYESTFSSLIVGDINLLKKAKINIDRNAFSNDFEIYKIILNFEYDIFIKLFKNLENEIKSKNEWLIITNTFLTNYIGYLYRLEIFDERFTDFFKKYLYVKVYKNSSEEIFNLATFLFENDNFILVSEDEDYINLSKEFNIPIIILEASEYQTLNYTYIQIFETFIKLHHTIHYYNNLGYDLFKKDEQLEIYIEKVNKVSNVFGRFREIIPSNSNKFLVSSWSDKPQFEKLYISDETYYNFNHHFYQFLINNYDEITNDISIKKILNSAYKYLNEEQEDGKIDLNIIKQLNEILSPLNKFDDFKNFEESDFI